MPSYPLNNVTAPDSYTQASTVGPGGPYDHINLDVANSAIYWSWFELQTDVGRASGSWSPDVFMPPGSRTIRRPGLGGLRFRAAIAGANLPANTQQAQVTVEAVG